MLRAVRLRLRRQHVASAARSAAWLTVVVAVVGLLLHAFVRPVQAGGVGLVVAFTWLLAIAQATWRPIDIQSCAGWADRFLDGTSAYETYLEGRDSTRDDHPAWRRLVEWLANAAPRSLERLASTPQDLRLHRPLAIALVAVTLAAALLQVPMKADLSSAQTGSAARAVDPSPRDRARGDAIESRGRDAVVRSDAALAQSRNATEGASSRRGSGAAAVDSTQDNSATSENSRGAPAALAAERAAAGGRDAGSTADTAEDPGLSEAWQGKIAAQFRELPGSSQEPSRADATLAADYDERLATGDAADTGEIIEPAAAIAPEARDRTPLGPAEQAYVRAYFADSGATP